MNENGRKRVGHGRRARLSPPLARLLENAEVSGEISDYLCLLGDLDGVEVPELVSRLVSSQASLDATKDALEIMAKVAEDDPRTKRVLDALEKLVDDASDEDEGHPFVWLLANVAGMAMGRGVGLGVALEQDRRHARHTRMRSRPGR